ncbi:MAG: hypothetical protein JJU45_13835 [Acidimicrobiia bacterium]|nr:hypothetical protein [Acidimicrobiia bacterium]
MRRGLIPLCLVVTASACTTNDRVVTSAGEPEGSADDQVVCADIERFAEALVDTGIAYDYLPSESPADLAAEVDVVFGGQLTGQVRAVGEDTPGGTFSPSSVVYDVEVTRAVASSPEVGVGDTVEVLVPFNPGHQELAEYREAVTPGIEVAIFAIHHGITGDVFGEIEGFITACPDGPLLGWTGFRRGWDELSSVNDVLDAADVER